MQELGETRQLWIAASLMPLAINATATMALQNLYRPPGFASLSQDPRLGWKLWLVKPWLCASALASQEKRDQMSDMSLTSVMGNVPNRKCGHSFFILYILINLFSNLNSHSLKSWVGSWVRLGLCLSISFHLSTRL